MKRPAAPAGGSTKALAQVPHDLPARADSLSMNRRPATTLFPMLRFALVWACVVCLGPIAAVPAAVHAAVQKKRVVHRALGSRAALLKTTAQTKAEVPKAPPKPAAVQAPVIAGGPWTEPTFADSTLGDHVDGEDLNVRRAAVEALGPYNGSVVAVDPASGRVLTMVNQKIATGSGFQPCSTIKVSVALAGLSEKVIQPATKLRVPGMRMDLTYALAHSNNYYFATLGQKLGFEKVSYYAHLY